MEIVIFRGVMEPSPVLDTSTYKWSERTYKEHSDENSFTSTHGNPAAESRFNQLQMIRHKKGGRVGKDYFPRHVMEIIGGYAVEDEEEWHDRDMRHIRMCKVNDSLHVGTALSDGVSKLFIVEGNVVHEIHSVPHITHRGELVYVGNNRVMQFGGFKEGDYRSLTNTIVAIDITGREAEARVIGHMLEPRYDFTATLMEDNRVLICGGGHLERVVDAERNETADEGGYTLEVFEKYANFDQKSCELYSVSRNASEKAPSMRRGRDRASAVLIPSRTMLGTTLLRAGAVLVSGGLEWGKSTTYKDDRQFSVASYEIFNPYSNEWLATMAEVRPYVIHAIYDNPMPTHRFDHGSAMKDSSTILFFSGYGGFVMGVPVQSSHVSAYNIQTGKWLEYKTQEQVGKHSQKAAFMVKQGRN